MARRSRTVEVFGLSFLDLLSCGLGSLMLLFVIDSERHELGDGGRRTDFAVQQIPQARIDIGPICDHLVECRTRGDTASRASGRPAWVELSITQCFLRNDGEDARAATRGPRACRASLQAP